MGHNETRDYGSWFEAFARPGREWIRDVYSSYDLEAVNKRAEELRRPYRFLLGLAKAPSIGTKGLWREACPEVELVRPDTLVSPCPYCGGLTSYSSDQGWTCENAYCRDAEAQAKKAIQRKLIEAEFPDRGKAAAFCEAMKRAIARDNPPVAFIPPASLGVKVSDADVAARYDAIMKGVMG